MTPHSVPVNWNDVPAEIQKRVVDLGIGAVGDLAQWAYQHRPVWARDDEVNDILRALILFLRRSPDGGRRRLQSLPAILTTIAYRQRCQRYRDQAVAQRAQLQRLPAAAGTNELSHVFRVDLRNSLNKALKRLSKREQEVIVRKHLLDQSCREIAKAVFGAHAGRKEEGHVSVIVARAREKMRVVLREDDV